MDRRTSYTWGVFESRTETELRGVTAQGEAVHTRLVVTTGVPYGGEWSNVAICYHFRKTT